MAPQRVEPPSYYYGAPRNNAFHLAVSLGINFVAVILDTSLAFRGKRGRGPNIGRVNRAICS